MAFKKITRITALALLALHAANARAETPPSVIDWSKGDTQDTAAPCGEISFKNLADHHGYSLWVRGTAQGTCSFKADGLTFHLPPNYGPTTPATTTLYAFRRFGSDVLVTWQPGL